MLQFNNKSFGIVFAAALLLISCARSAGNQPHEIFLVKVEKEGEKGFQAEAELSPVSWRHFNGEIREAGESIVKQYAEYTPPPPESSIIFLPGIYIRSFSSIDEAMDYIGLAELKTPAFPYEDYQCAVICEGEENGRVNKVVLKLSHINDKEYTAQETMTILTDAAKDTKIVSGGAWTDEWPRNLEFLQYSTPAGKDCRIVVMKPRYQSKYIGLTGFVVDGNAFCEMNLGSVLREDTDYAIQILHDWADAFD
ncbi:MAG: hypothetical protein IJJ44_03695 [Solobacterium sp.]|nr:hypothetical protein [Solobacterium sp.]